MLFFAVIALLSVFGTVHSDKKVVACYYGTWATYRPGLGNFSVDDVDPFLCTQLIYAFAGINTNGTVISLDPHLDLPVNKDNFRKFNDLKQINPSLKTFLAVGGWNEGSSKYSVMAASPVLRQNFIQSSLQMISDYGFDGLDMDWLYPNGRDTVNGEADIDNFTQLLKEIREEFDNYGLMLTAAVAAHKGAVSLFYDVPSIVELVDYIYLMTYDMYGPWGTVTGHNAPLHKGADSEDVDGNNLFTVDEVVDNWLEAGCSPEKLVLGVPLYGATYTLSSANENAVGDPISGPGISGSFTQISGVIGYNEFCSKLQIESWTIQRDDMAKVPYAYNGVYWVSYEDSESIRDKVEYALSLNLAGIKVWSIETDDFNNVCGDGRFPLLSTINDVLESNANETTTISITAVGS